MPCLPLQPGAAALRRGAEPHLGAPQLHLRSGGRGGGLLGCCECGGAGRQWRACAAPICPRRAGPSPLPFMLRHALRRALRADPAGGARQGCRGATAAAPAPVQCAAAMGCSVRGTRPPHTLRRFTPLAPVARHLPPQTTCADSLTTADWIFPMWSPRVHRGEGVDAGLLSRRGAAAAASAMDAPVCSACCCRTLLPWADCTQLLTPVLPCCRLRKQRGSDADCGAADATASAAAFFRRRGGSTTLAGTPLPGSSGTGAASSSQRRRSMQQQEWPPQRQGAQPHAEEQRSHGRRLGQQEGEPPVYRSLGDTCFLFARKFGPDAVPVRPLPLCFACRPLTAFMPGVPDACILAGCLPA